MCTEDLNGSKRSLDAGDTQGLRSLFTTSVPMLLAGRGGLHSVCTFGGSQRPQECRAWAALNYSPRHGDRQFYGKRVEGVTHGPCVRMPIRKASVSTHPASSTIRTKQFRGQSLETDRTVKARALFLRLLAAGVVQTRSRARTLTRDRLEGVSQGRVTGPTLFLRLISRPGPPLMR